MSEVEGNLLFAWLVEEVGELSKVLVRERFEKRDPEDAINEELADVWNCLHALAFKQGITPSKLKQFATLKGANGAKKEGNYEQVVNDG